MSSAETAEREGKRILLCETGAYCHPCRLLAQFLDDHRNIFGPNYLIVEIDRSRFAHGEEVMKRLRKGPDHSVPWCTILDDKGNVEAVIDAGAVLEIYLAQCRAAGHPHPNVIGA